MAGIQRGSFRSAGALIVPPIKPRRVGEPVNECVLKRGMNEAHVNKQMSE